MIIKSLAFPLLRPDADAEAFRTIIEEIYAEKYTVAPGCAACQTPCGNTSDYDMNRIYDAETDIRDLKVQMLAAMKELAADIYSRQKLDILPAESMEIFYKALAYISFDMEREGLITFWNEVQETIEKVRRQIQ